MLAAFIWIEGPLADTGTAPAVEEITKEKTIQTKPIVVLSEQDASIYAEIFRLQKDGHWQQADKLIARLGNDILLGHVLFQRYMHPTAYRSRFSELSKWLDRYDDHPGASRIYRLGKRRQGRARAPKAPAPAYNADNHLDGAKKKAADKNPKRSKSDASNFRRVSRAVRRYVARQQPERAEKRLWAFERLGVMSAEETDALLTQIAGAYFFSSQDEKALALASAAASRSRKEMSQPDWISGLAAWRSGDCQVAARHFDAVAASAVAGSWTNAAGAFWASRAYLACHQPQLVEARLRLATEFKETFYGLVAARQLGVAPIFEWSLPEMSADDLKILQAYPGAQRAIALRQAGWSELADEELRLLFTREGTKLRIPLATLAAHLGLPATQVFLAGRSVKAGKLPLTIHYPLPEWEPEGGFTIDRAVFFGMMRQESGFRPRARSPAGAMGLMQLMPDTASWLMKDRSLRRSKKSRLYEPVLNMTISQTYINMLLETEWTDGNLFKLATAYNGGPGNLLKWQKTMNFKNDPLLFIETIPARETRNFIERVFANIWIYRARLGQPAPSLEAVASGAWPEYEAQDPKILEGLSGQKEKDALHAKN